MHRLWPHTKNNDQNFENRTKKQMTNGHATEFNVVSKSESSDERSTPNKKTNESKNSDSNQQENEVSNTIKENNENQNDSTFNQTKKEKIVGEVAQKPQEQKKQQQQKTPMCLINELVKFNKIKHEYSLLDEVGPAHKKIFTVQLKLGNLDVKNHEASSASTELSEIETYVANGTSIKRAQQTVAEQAYNQTKFKKLNEIKKDKKSNSNSNKKIENKDNQSGALQTKQANFSNTNENYQQKDSNCNTFMFIFLKFSISINKTCR
jgi:hypothetical protein